MAETNLTNFHYSYIDLLRHWDSGSEPYTGGDALYTAMSHGWKLDETVRYEECWLMGGRFVVVYYFTLKRGGETVTMPVLTNPHVRRLMSTLDVKLVAMGDKKIKPVVKR